MVDLQWFDALWHGCILEVSLSAALQAYVDIEKPLGVCIFHELEI